MADRVGQQLGHYRLVRLLGSGGFADVYQGIHIYLNKLVAVKVLHVHLVQQEYAGFLEEAKTIARLNHPHIIQVLDFGIDGTPFLVIDYLPLGSLRQRYSLGTRLPLPSIVSYVNQIASALQYAHDAKIIHREIKPDNILMRDSEQLILTDFGIAAVAHRTSSLQTLNVAGSPSYMAPEQISGKPRPASDQYALGMMVYEWLCGKPAFQGDLLALLYQQAYAPIPSLRQQLPSITPKIEEVILTALAKDPQKRFENIEAFSKALEEASKQKPLSKPPSRSQSLSLEIAQLTDVGRKRPHNEDHMAHVIPKDPQILSRKGAIFVVADGMGINNSGAIASEIAVETISVVYYQDDNEDVSASLVHAIKRANTFIHQRAAENKLRSGMGTTCVAAVLRGNTAYIANVGDSRLYLVRGNQVKQISQDHSRVTEQGLAKLLNKERTSSHPRYLTRCLGAKQDVDVDLFIEPLENEDTLVLCSDGLYRLISEDELRDIITQFSPVESVYHLINRANEMGGSDNITAIVVQILEVG